jgi:hypothetical protein
MLKTWINKIVSYYGIWRLAHILLATSIFVFIGIIILAVITPIQLNSNAVNVSTNVNLAANNYLSEVLQSKSLDMKQLVEAFRPNLFRASTSPRDKPMAEETIEKIKSKLKLQCIVEISGEPVAYVNIQGTGLKKCKIGDSISDLFTILNIYQNSVEISIIGHKVVLAL